MNQNSLALPPQNDASLPSSKWLWMIWIALVLAILVATLLMQQRLMQQEIQHWQRQMEHASRVSVAALDAMLSEHRRTLEQVAANVSVQLYMTELTNLPEAASKDMPERGYLENLLIATANKGGFKPALASESVVNATTQHAPDSGIGLADTQGGMIVATRSMPAIQGVLKDFLAQAPDTSASISVPVKLSQNQWAFLLQAPIFSVQSEPTKDNLIGRVVGVRLLQPALFDTVRASAVNGASAQLALVSRSPVVLLGLEKANITQAALPATPEAQPSAEQQALKTIARVVRGTGLQRAEIFAAVQSSALTGVALLHTLPTQLALADARTQALWIWTVVALCLMGITVFLWALLRHSVGLKAAAAANHYQTLAKQLDTKSRLLGLVMDTTPNIITIVDDESRVCFTNWRDSTGGSTDMQGKTLAALRGEAAVARMLARNATVIASAETVSEVEVRGADKHTRFIHVPLKSIPVDLPFLSAQQQGVLIIEEDVTELAQERARSEQTLQRIVDCLVGFVDQRDPYAAKHSVQVARIARAIAGVMQQPDAVQETSEMAGKLLNIGKMHVPEEVLQQAGSLDGEALKRIRDAISSSADVVEGIAFRGPVADTIRQSMERMDGSGPLGLKGDQILLTARIVAVANAYVGMTSARAYRAPLSTEVACEQLMKSAGHLYDFGVVAAWVHALKNNGKGS